MKRKKFLSMLVAVFTLVTALANFTNVTTAKAAEKTKTIYYDNTITGWSEVYAYTWNSYTCENDVIQLKAKGSNATFEGELKDTAKYNMIVFKNTSGTDNWDEQTIDLKVPQNDYSTLAYFNHCKNDEGKYTGYFTPDRYKLVTIWYDKGVDGELPFIHYQTNNSAWTKNLGFKMVESGYRPYYAATTILVPTEQFTGSITCVFHDGKGNFDNNKGRNYYYTVNSKTDKQEVIIIR